MAARLQKKEEKAKVVQLKKVNRKLFPPKKRARKSPVSSDTDSDQTPSLKSSSGASDSEDAISGNEITGLSLPKKDEGEFVAVRYDGKVFPGVVLEVLEDGARVKSMKKNGQLWKWPERDDILFYSWKNGILGHIEPPSKFSSRREIFSVPELAGFD